MKRGLSEPMETDEVDTSSMPKKQKTEQEQKLVQFKRSNTKDKYEGANEEEKCGRQTETRRA